MCYAYEQVPPCLELDYDPGGNLSGLRLFSVLGQTRERRLVIRLAPIKRSRCRFGLLPMLRLDIQALLCAALTGLKNFIIAAIQSFRPTFMAVFHFILTKKQAAKGCTTRRPNRILTMG